MNDNKTAYTNIETTGAITTATVSATPGCKHANGWYHSIPFWIFQKRVFACTDCGAVLHGDKLKKWEGK